MKTDDKDYSKLFAEYLSLIDFELHACEEDERKATDKYGDDHEGGYRLVDLQCVNLGDIESDRFDNAEEVIDRLEIYHLDYIFNDEEWGEFGSFEEVAKCPEHPMREFADMIAYHTDEIDLRKVVAR